LSNRSRAFYSRGSRLVEECPAAHGQIDGIGIVRPLAQGALTLDIDERHVQRAGDALSDVVLDFWALRDLNPASLDEQRDLSLPVQAIEHSPRAAPRRR
jgi:hypothetical protein